MQLLTPLLWREEGGGKTLWLNSLSSWQTKGSWRPTMCDSGG